MRVLIADDHTILRQGLLKIIEGKPSIEVVAETGDGEEALELILSLKPDVAVLDINMPGKSGLEIVKACGDTGVATEFIILTMYKEQEYFDEALDSGVKGYILKENASSDLLDCIASVAAGKPYVSPILSEYLIHSDGRRRRAQEELPLLQRLTEMERKVLKLIAQNKTSKEIAGELFISYRTVQNHRNNICTKLNLKGYNKLLQFALEHRSLLEESGEAVSEGAGAQNPEARTSADNRRMWRAMVAAVLLALMITAGWLYFELRSAGDAGSPMPVTDVDRNRIAVLPFVNIGPEPDDDFLTDGLTEEIISRLSRINQLRVIARTSVMKYKNTLTSVDKIGEELQVGTVLEGSVRQVGNRLRVTAQLIDAQTQEHLWSRDYDRNLQDMLAVQSDIANHVADALKVELLGVRHDTSTVNPQSYISYLKGRYFLNQRDRAGFDKARRYFQQVIDREPDYALAYAGLADTYILLCNYGFMTPQQGFPKAKAAASKALQIDPDLAEAHNSLGTIHLLYDWDWQAAEAEFRLALWLNPSYATAHQIYGLFLVLMGREAEAIESVRHAVRLDPLSPVVNAVLGRVHYHAGQYDLAVKQLGKSIELNPRFWLAYSFLGEVYLEINQGEEAVAALEKAVTLSQDDPFALARLGYALAAIGQKTQARDILAQLREHEAQGTRLSYQIALLHAALGETATCFDWLQKAYEQRHDFMPDLKVDPKWQGLRSDPRFTALLEKMELAD